MRFPFPFPRHNKTAYIRIDLSRCQACGACVEACTGGILALGRFLSHCHVHVDRPKDCKGCLKCAGVCERNAVRSRLPVEAGIHKPRGSIQNFQRL